VLTLVSSLSAVGFVTGNNVNLVFAKKHDSSSRDNSGGGGSSKDKGGSGGSSDGTTTGGSDTTGSGGTSNTSPPPAPSTAENTPSTKSTQQRTCLDGSTPDANGKCPPSTPATSSAPTTCPDGSAPDANGKCPTANSQTCPDGSAPASDGTCPSATTNPTQEPQTCADGTALDASGNCPSANQTPTNETTPSETQGTAPSAPTTCPDGSAPASGGTCPSATNSTQGITPPQALIQQPQAHYDIPPDYIFKAKLADGSCPAGFHQYRTDSNQPCIIDSEKTLPGGSCPGGTILTNTAALNGTCVAPPVFPGSTTGPGGGFIQMIPTCPGGATPDANHKCPATPPATPPTNTPPQPTPVGDGSFQLPTVPPVPNTNTIAPICPSGSHLELNKCVVDGVQCPSGTVQDGDKCTPAPPATPPTNTPPLTPKAKQLAPLAGGGTDNGTNTGGGGTTTTTTPAAQDGGIILVPSNPDGSCPAGSHKFLGSQVCQKDTATTTSGGGQVPPECQGIVAGPKDKCSLDTSTSPTLINGAPQALTPPQACPLPPDSAGKCPVDDVRGPIPTSDGTYRLPTFPPIFGGAGGDDILGRCPSGSHKIVIINKCAQDFPGCPPETHPVADLCSRVPPVEIPANPDGSCEGVLDPISNKCYKDSEHAPPCPSGASRDAYGFCMRSPVGIPIPVVPEVGDGTCDNGGVHIAYKHGFCFAETTTLNLDGSCQTGYISTGNSCTIRIHDPLPDGSCPGGYSNFAAPTAIGHGGTLCKLNVDKSSANPTAELPGGYCPTGYHHVSMFTRFRYCQLN